MKNRVRGNVPVMRAHLQNQSPPISEPLPPLSDEGGQVEQDTQIAANTEFDGFPETVSDVVGAAVEGVSETTEDDSWLDNLTPYDSHSYQQSTQEFQPPQTSFSPNPPIEEPANPYSGFEHIDEDVVSELDAKMLAPLRAELETLKALRKQEETKDEARRLTEANLVITERYPKAEKILRSSEFVAFINGLEDLYSSDTGFDKLARAYRSGDGQYVVGKLDQFMEHRGKPKPKVGIEPQRGSTGTNTAGRTKPKLMTEAEYLAKRQQLRSLHRHKNSDKPLKQLAEQYQNSLKRGKT